MGCDSLALSDILELVCFCALIFIPLGIWIKLILPKVIIFLTSWRNPVGIESKGSFTNFISKE